MMRVIVLNTTVYVFIYFWEGNEWVSYQLHFYPWREPRFPDALTDPGHYLSFLISAILVSGKLLSIFICLSLASTESEHVYILMLSTHVWPRGCDEQTLKSAVMSATLTLRLGGWSLCSYWTWLSFYLLLMTSLSPHTAPALRHPGMRPLGVTQFLCPRSLGQWAHLSRVGWGGCWSSSSGLLSTVPSQDGSSSRVTWTLHP